jgi:hypothetical protein
LYQLQKRLKEFPMRRDHSTLTAVGALLSLILGSTPVRALSVNSATVSFNAKKTDGFKLSGEVPGLSLNGVEAVRLEFGIVAQSIPLSAFTRKGGKYSFKAPKDATGIVKLSVDLGKGTFSAMAKGLALSGLANPAPTRLVAGAFEECTMPRFAETKSKWSFNAKKAPQYPCQITDVPSADPTGFLVDSSTSVRVQARISPNPGLDQSSVRLLRLDDEFAPVGSPLCTLVDDGSLERGDDIAGDSVFSCFATFLESSPGTIRLIVRADVAATEVVSPTFFLNVVTPLTADAASVAESVQSQASDLWQANASTFGDTIKARVVTAKQIAVLDGVKAAGVSSDDVTIWIEYESGISGGLMLNPVGTKGTGGTRRVSRKPAVAGPGLPPVSFARRVVSVSAHSAASVGPGPLQAAMGDDDAVQNTKVLVWDPYDDQFPTEGQAYVQIYQGSACPKFNVTHLTRTQASVDSVAGFTQYGTVILSTHGAVDGSGKVVFLTREEATAGNMLAHAIDLLLGRIVVMGDVFAVRPAFITNLPGAFERSIVYNSSCESSANATMASAFFGKGAATYYGYTRVVNGGYAQGAGTQLLTGLVTNQLTTGDAFAAVTPKVDPDSPFATFTIGGDQETVYSGDFRNGGFETGDLTAWTRAGDGRVVATLGGFTPTEGVFAGLVSTGLGFTTASGSVEQNFCLPKSATQIAFDWHFNSEEFIEWCGSPFQDTFAVELETDGGTNLLFQRTIDSLCGSVLPTGLAFDQSGPGCVPDSENDCTVWGTGWQSQALDIAALATANDGKGVTLRFRAHDVGDSIFDSAILLDRIRIVMP